MLKNLDGHIITPPNIILHPINSIASDFIDAADDAGNIKNNNNYIQALRYLTDSFDNEGLMPYLTVFYPGLGGSAVSHSMNLINPGLYQITFNGSWIHDVNGMKPNGAGAYAETGLPYSMMTHNNIHLLFGCVENVQDNGIDISFLYEASVDNRLLMHVKYSNGNHLSDVYSGVANRIAFNNPSAIGVYITNRTSNVYAEVIKDGLSKGVNGSNSLGSIASTATLKMSGSPIYPTLYSSKRWGVAGAGLGIPTDKAKMLTMIVNNYLKMVNKI